MILYAQNYRLLLKNAVFLTIFAWILSFVIFLIVIAPVAALVSVMPGLGGFWTLIIAIITAYALKAALIDPFAMACIVQVYFQAIAGQTPSPNGRPPEFALSPVSGVRRKGRSRDGRQQSSAHLNLERLTTDD